MQLLRDNILCFEIDGLVKVSFVYKPKEVYSVQIIEPQKYDKAPYLKMIVSDLTKSFFDAIKKVLQYSKEAFGIIRSHIQTSISSVTEIDRDQSLEMLLQQLIAVDWVMKVMDDKINLMLNSLIDEMCKLTVQVNAAHFIDRKLQMNLVTYQRVYQEGSKVAALLIVMVKRRAN